MVKIVKKHRCVSVDKCHLRVIKAFLTFIRRNREFYDDNDNGNVNGDDDGNEVTFIVEGLWFIVGTGFARPNVGQTTDYADSRRLKVAC
jgi:hypothetical protein